MLWLSLGLSVLSDARHDTVLPVFLVTFGLYVVWIIVFSAFAGALLFFGRHTVAEKAGRPNVLEELELAHAAGELSDEEYERKRAEIEDQMAA